MVSPPLSPATTSVMPSPLSVMLTVLRVAF